MIRSLVCTVLLLAVLSISSSCILVGFPKKGHGEQRPTVGEELIDLKKAYEEGALTQEEYKQAKDKFLKKD